LALASEIRVCLLPSAVGSSGPYQYANTFVVNDCIAVDAGSIGFVGSPEAQRRVRTVILTHSHADHIASLPILLINDHQPGTDCIRVWATRETRECLRRDVFNDRIWPDLDALGTAADPFVEWREIRSEEPFEVEGLRFTAVPVDHTVPTVGFLVEGDGVSVVLGGDSAPTDLIWQRARGLEGLRGVFLEASFPNEEQDLADASGHLTPATFGGEVAKLPAGVPVFAVHFKPSHHGRIRAQLERLGLERLHVVTPGEQLVFDADGLRAR